MTRGHDQDDAVTLACRVRGDNIFLKVDGDSDMFGHDTVTTFRERGITFSNAVFINGTITQTVTVSLIATNNNTVVVCYATDDALQNVVSSDPATILIAGLLCCNR